MITGKVVFEATADTWREGLRWMNHLYEEGLFYAEETYVQDRDQLRAVVNVADPTQYVVGAIPTFWEGRFVDLSVSGLHGLHARLNLLPVKTVYVGPRSLSPKTLKLSALSLPSAPIR